MFSHSSHLVQAQCAFGVAAVKGCGAPCSEHGVTRVCLGLEEALDLGRADRKRGNGEDETLSNRRCKKEPQIKSLHVLHVLSLSHYIKTMCNIP